MNLTCCSMAEASLTDFALTYFRPCTVYLQLWTLRFDSCCCTADGSISHLQLNLTDLTFTYYNPYMLINCTLASAKLAFALSELFPTSDVLSVGETGYHMPGSGGLPLGVSLTADNTSTGA